MTDLPSVPERGYPGGVLLSERAKREQSKVGEKLSAVSLVVFQWLLATPSWWTLRAVSIVRVLRLATATYLVTGPHLRKNPAFRKTSH